MDDPGNIDWSLIRAFLAVAECGSLSGAARRLTLSQPTLGRQVQALEAQLGATLFRRQPRGMALSQAGHDLLEPARAMQAAAARLALAAAGRDRALAGTVRITASAFAAVHHLPPILAALRRDTPEIELELVASDASDNLLFREADIAVRMYRPRQMDVVTRHLGGFEMGAFATRDYLARHGRPDSIAALMTHDIVGMDRDDRLIQGLADFDIEVGRDFFPVRCDDTIALYQLICAGCGIGFAQTAVAGRDPGLVRLLPDVPIPALPVWLTCHEAVRRNPRVRHVWQALERGLAAGLLAPGDPRCAGHA